MWWLNMAVIAVFVVVALVIVAGVTVLVIAIKEAIGDGKNNM